jgi:hypothetical protein
MSWLLRHFRNSKNSIASRVASQVEESRRFSGEAKCVSSRNPSIAANSGSKWTSVLVVGDFVPLVWLYWNE